MGASFIPITVFTVLWGIVGIVCPFFAPKGPNRGIIQVVLILTAATCWLFWLCAYMAQMNPLIGPRLNNETLIWMSRTWPGALLCVIYFITTALKTVKENIVRKPACPTTKNLKTCDMVRRWGCVVDYGPFPLLERRPVSQ